MTFDWATQKDAWQGKLKVAGLGSATGNAPGSKTIKSLDLTLQIIDVMGQTGSLEESGSPIQPTVSVKKGGEDNAYVLPWKSCAATVTKLGGNQQIFVTAQLTGCAVFVGGDSASPTVIHANATPEYLDAGMPEQFEQKLEFYNHTRAPRLNAYYGAVAQKLATTGDLPTKNAKTILPSDYASSGNAAVFGVKDGGSWKLYVNAGNDTTCFWPAA